MLQPEVEEQIELLYKLCKANLWLYNLTKQHWWYEEALDCKNKAREVYDKAMEAYNNCEITQEIEVI